MWTYKVRTMKNCPLRACDLIQDFSRFGRAALNVRSITLRFSNSGGVALGSTGFTPRAGLPFSSGSWRRRGAGETPRSSARRAPKRGHAVHFGVQENIYEHLYLGKLLSEQRRNGCLRHGGGKFIEPELKFVWS